MKLHSFSLFSVMMLAMPKSLAKRRFSSGHGICELGISYLVIWKRDAKNEMANFICTSHYIWKGELSCTCDVWHLCPMSSIWTMQCTQNYVYVTLLCSLYICVCEPWCGITIDVSMNLSWLTGKGKNIFYTASVV